MAINANKEDIVKIENHITKKIRLGYLKRCYQSLVSMEYQLKTDKSYKN